MKTLLLVLSLMVIFQKPLANAQEEDSILPTLNECGKLKEDYLYSKEHVTKFDEFPWIARISTKRQGETESTYSCLGVLLSKRYVLSTSTCLTNSESSTLLLGDWDASNNATERDCNDWGDCAPLPVEYAIEEIVLQPRDSIRDVTNKLALLRLATDVTFTDYIRPICLPSEGVETTAELVSHYFTTAGFEHTSARNNNANQRSLKFKALVNVMNLERCRERFSRTVIPDTVICTGCVSKITPLGGAPLMGVSVENSKPIRYYLIGVLSAGDRERVCNAMPSDIYIRISSHIEWVKYNMF